MQSVCAYTMDLVSAYKQINQIVRKGKSTWAGPV